MTPEGLQCYHTEITTAVTIATVITSLWTCTGSAVLCPSALVPLIDKKRTNEGRGDRASILSTLHYY